jgi:hypothetical protein
MTISEELPTKQRWRRLAGPAIILLAALIATGPQLFRHNSCGHDFDFHLVSWIDAKASWQSGILYPHWSPRANFGAGEARFVFYPPLTWMLGAAMGFVLSWRHAAIAMTFLFLAGTGLATRKLAREAIGDAPATLAGCAALFSGYTLFTAYERSAFGELAGGFWIPLLLLLILRDRNPGGIARQRAFDGSAVPLALVLTGAWLSNAPIGVMASYLLAAVALVWAMLLRSWAPLVRAGFAAALALGIAAFYLVPATVEQRWVDIRQAIDDPGSVIENSWLFARHADPALELHDLELLRVSVIGLTMIAVAIGAVLLAWRRGKLLQRWKWWTPLALIPVVVLMLQLPLSLPVWNALPKLRFLQFPWRWLVTVEAPMGIFFASAVWITGRRLQRALIFACTTFFLGIAVVTWFLFFQPCEFEDSAVGVMDAYWAQQGYEGVDEYAPPNTDSSLLPTGLPDACFTSNPLIQLGHGEDGTTPTYRESSCDATFSWDGDPFRRDPEHLVFAASVPQPGYLILKLRTFPAWRVKVNGKAIDSMTSRADGLMAFSVSGGTVRVAADWSTTADVVFGRLVTAFSLVLLACAWWLERRPGAIAHIPTNQERLAGPQLS